MVAHTWNPSYSGGRDQEDRSLKPVRGNSLRDPILKKIHDKKVGVAQGVGPEFKPQYSKKIKSSDSKSLLYLLFLVLALLPDVHKIKASRPLR
jgi:hypothetical protein